MNLNAVKRNRDKFENIQCDNKQDPYQNIRPSGMTLLRHTMIIPSRT